MVSVGYVVRVGSNKEEFKSNMDKEGLRIKSSMEIVGESTGYRVDTKKKEKEIYKLYADMFRRE